MNRYERVARDLIAWKNSDQSRPMITWAELKWREGKGVGPRPGVGPEHFHAPRPDTPMKVARRIGRSEEAVNRAIRELHAKGAPAPGRDSRGWCWASKWPTLRLP